MSTTAASTASSSSPRIYRIPFQRDQSGYFAVVIRNVLTDEECRQLIQRSHNHGYEPALLNIGGGKQILAASTRKSDRCIMDDPILAEEIYQRIQLALGGLSDTEKERLRLDYLYRPSFQASPVGMNERLRFLRYGPGDYFRAHFDGCYVRRGGEAGEDRQGERSYVTCQIYLNQGFTGGATTFFSSLSQEEYNVVPETGSVLLFEHGLLHQGSQLLEGVKYAIRSDIMYTSKGPGHEYSKKPIKLKTMSPSP